ncbi:cul1 [Blepharisma stoltei]|uniref:Cullin family profile domain-containing protein n=1 Tax=Blepharisma stoltei TaxID=1481888 RepID=A0AAU9IGN7_9CILI|nr:unnamed protein product [Blepharisma stoltei]
MKIEKLQIKPKETEKTIVVGQFIGKENRKYSRERIMTLIYFLINPSEEFESSWLAYKAEIRILQREQPEAWMNELNEISNLCGISTDRLFNFLENSQKLDLLLKNDVLNDLDILYNNASLFIPHEIENFKHYLQQYFTAQNIEKMIINWIKQSDYEALYKYTRLLNIYNPPLLDHHLTQISSQLFENWPLAEIMMFIESMLKILKINPSGKLLHGVYMQLSRRIQDKDGFEGICSYFDTELRENRKPKGQCELFMLCEDKDKLEKLYHIQTIYRIINGNDLELERDSLKELKELSGSERMDSIATLIENAFESKEYNVVKSINVLTLSHKAWCSSITPYPKIKNILEYIPNSLPQQLSNLVIEYQNFYLKKNEKKQLKWAYLLGNLELKTGSLTIACNFLQSLIILMFNSVDEIDENEIMYKLFRNNIKTSILTEEIVRMEIEKLKMIIEKSGTKLRLNLKKNVEIINLVETENKEKENSLYSNVEEDRKPILDAALMKLLKKNKQMTISALIERVVPLMPFKVAGELISIRLEHLVKSELLWEVEGTYGYIP